MFKNYNNIFFGLILPKPTIVSESDDADATNEDEIGRTNDIAQKAVLKCLGNPTDLEKFPCDEKLRHVMYVQKEISWNFWTNDIKKLLLKSLFDEFDLRKIKTYPQHRHIQVRVFLITF